MKGNFLARFLSFSAMTFEAGSWPCIETKRRAGGMQWITEQRSAGMGFIGLKVRLETGDGRKDRWTS